jgi:hypothetical protein
MDAVYYELIQGCRGEAFDVGCLVADGLSAWNAEATITHYYTIVREARKSPTETVIIFTGKMDRMFSSLTGLGEAVSDNYKRSALISALLATEGPDTEFGRFLNLIRTNTALVGTYDTLKKSLIESFTRAGLSSTSVAESKEDPAALSATRTSFSGDVECYSCGRLGHYLREYHSRGRN